MIIYHFILLKSPMNGEANPMKTIIKRQFDKYVWCVPFRGLHRQMVNPTDKSIRHEVIIYNRKSNKITYWLTTREAQTLGK